MTDTDLDDLLNAWLAPSPDESLRERLQAGIAVRRPRPVRRLLTPLRLWAMAATVILVVLIVNPDAFSKKVSTYTVDSEVTLHRGPEGVGLPQRVLMTSYNDAGTEVLRAWSFPDQPVETALLKTRMLANDTRERLARPFEKIAKYYYIVKYGLATPPEDPDDAYAIVYPNRPDTPLLIGKRAALVSSDCRTIHGGAEVIGHDVVMNYATTILQQRNGGARKLTLWMAPELSCFALRATIHEMQPDGSWKLVSEKKALKVNVNP